MKRIIVILICFNIVSFSFGQHISLDDKGSNKYSIKPIPESHIMYQKMMWRMIDLREKQNQPFFAQNREVTQIIIDAVKSGKVKAWKNDSLAEGTEITKKAFLEKLIIPETDNGYDDNETMDFFGDDSFNDETQNFTNDNESAESIINQNKKQNVFHYEGKDLWQLEIKENFIFDKQRSITVRDIIAMTIVIPADHPDNIKGIEEVVASFSYKELVENVFSNNPKAIWYNPYNDKEHKSLADAFELRLFSSYITKINNPRNERIVDVYGGDPRKGLEASMLEENKLLEFTHNLWSY